MNAARDKIGQAVRVGDFIAYGHALGRCAGIRIGRVLALAPSAAGYCRDPGWKATVIGVEDDWTRATDEAVRLCAKTGTLFFPNRWIRLDPATLPESYRIALNSYVFVPPKTKKRKEG